jgi:hypothetical protein
MPMLDQINRFSDFRRASDAIAPANWEKEILAI